MPGVGNIFPRLCLHGRGPLQHTPSFATLGGWKRIEAVAELLGNLRRHGCLKNAAGADRSQYPNGFNCWEHQTKNKQWMKHVYLREDVRCGHFVFKYCTPGSMKRYLQAHNSGQLKCNTGVTEEDSKSVTRHSTTNEEGLLCSFSRANCLSSHAHIEL